MAARPLPSSTEPAPPRPPAAERLSIEAGDPRLDVYRRVLSPEEFRGLHAWLTTFFPFQLDWLFEPARFAIGNKSRQIGWSHTTAAWLVLHAVFHRDPCTIISKGEKEAAEVLGMCGWHIETLRDLGCETMVATISSSTEEISFASGGRIVALASTAGRSFSGHLLLDEFGYHKHPDVVWEAAAPTTMVGGYKLRVVSTPNGQGNEFHRLWEVASGARELQLDDPRIPPSARDVRWAAHEVPLQKAIDQGYPVDLGACWTIYAKGDPRLFDQLFNCSFIDSTLQYFTSDKINACRTGLVLRPDERGLYYAGLDIGREADLSCLVVVRQLHDHLDPVHVEVIKRTDPDALKDMVAWAFKRYSLRRLCVDSTGLGAFPTDEMRKKHGDRVTVPHRRNRVEAVDFTLKSKEALVTNGYALITEQRLRLPDGDAQLPPFERQAVDGKGAPIQVNVPGTAGSLRKELGSIRRVVTPSGNVTYDAPRTSEGHADRAWALLLALYAVDTQHPMFAALLSRMAGGRPG